MSGYPSRRVISRSFPRISSLLVTVPHTFTGELPPELNGVPQLEVSVVAQDTPATAAEEKGAEMK